MKDYALYEAALFSRLPPLLLDPRHWGTHPTETTKHKMANFFLALITLPFVPLFNGESVESWVATLRLVHFNIILQFVINSDRDWQK